MQIDEMDCGATCLRTIFKFYGKQVSIQKIRDACQTTKGGVNLLGVSSAAESFGFRTFGIKTEVDQLEKVQLPSIVHWNQNHFVILYKIRKNKFYVSDPGSSTLTHYPRDEFLESWCSKEKEGIVLLLNPSPNFYNIGKENDDKKTFLNWRNFITYFSNYKSLINQLLIGVAIGSVLQLLAPFFTQAIIDIGIKSNNLDFINLILLGQIMVFLGSTTIAFVRSWILLHINTRVSISILSDLLTKIMKLPISFFELKTHGDLMKRMEDQKRIESFLTSSTINTVFSFTNFVIFSALLSFYDLKIFWVFIILSFIYFAWVSLFMKKRRELDNKRFDIETEDKTYTVEMFQKINDIKFTNSEKQKRWHWETIQTKLFKYKTLNLNLSQIQSGGSAAINQIKYIIIIYLSAKGVLNNEITLGTMMAIQYIVGSLSNPLEQFIVFIQSYQDAKISIERLNEIYEMDDEESNEQQYYKEIPDNQSIRFKSLSFKYIGAGFKPVFSNINLNFPEGKTTAIVGVSGSGKTTILKLLLRYYNPNSGEITIGDKNLNNISHKVWRESCGVVLQDSEIFADTISGNIAVGEENPNQEKINEAIRVANLQDYISQQPFGLHSKIGVTGKGLSQGQKQRLLIARAVYKNPSFLFLDEATNSLDAKNEKIIIENLEKFALKRTVIVVAHRLSTVKNADNILVLDKGELVEEGNHEYLISQKGYYFDLVKNQLELGN
ncbi:peptidase domain-containing ABC transporter [Sphingobacterium kitahiroshimense]|uniref:Peptidase domain-containing ABC transporter n=1 Tax=Sphingobacterium kitahiroshimense TaxID=470446 RepID=A0ABV0BRU7_9SPHI